MSTESSYSWRFSRRRSQRRKEDYNVSPATSKDAIPQSVYLKYIKREIESENACFELPVTISLLISFSVLALFHLNQTIVYMIEKAIHFDIAQNANFAFSEYFGHKTIEDVHSIADFWSWTRLGFVPLVFQPTWAYSESYTDAAIAAAELNASSPPYTPQPNSMWTFPGYADKDLPVKGDYLHFNRIIGGIRFRQQLGQLSEGTCRFPTTASRETWHKWYGKKCAPTGSELTFTATTVDTETFESKGVQQEFLLPTFDSYEQIMSQLVDMEDGCQQLESKNRTNCLCKWCAAQNPPSPWLTEGAQRVEVGFVTFNPNYGLITITGVHLFFSRGGRVHKRIETTSAWLDTMSGPLEDIIPMITFDVIWLGLQVMIFIKDLQDMISVARDGRVWWKAIRDEYTSFWNLVDWLVFIVAIGVALTYISLEVALRVLRSDLKAVVSARVEAVREEYVSRVLVFHDSVDAVMMAERNFQMCLCIYPMVVIVRLFKSFASQPRLAIVTETLVNASADMVHFFIVFFSVLMCLSIDSVLIFGRDLTNYATFLRSIHSSFRAMFGQWNFDEILEVRRPFAIVWFLIFRVVVNIILLNMLLAIIIESYASGKRKAPGAKTLVRQTSEIWQRFKQSRRRERMKLTHIYDSFEKEAKSYNLSEREMLRSERLIDAEVLMKLGLSEDQAALTLKEAVADEDPPPDFALREGLGTIDRICSLTHSTRDDLFFIYDRVNFYVATRIDSGSSPQQNLFPLPLANSSSERTEEEKLDALKSIEVAEEQQMRALDGLVQFVNTEITRLGKETASVLAHTVQRVDERQTAIENRQHDMLSAVSELQEALQLLQAEAYTILLVLQKRRYEAKVQPSSWKKKAGVALPLCFEWTPNASEGERPKAPWV